VHPGPLFTTGEQTGFTQLLEVVAPGDEAIIEKILRRTGSPRALNMAAAVTACPTSRTAPDRGGQHPTAWAAVLGASMTDDFDIHLS
jgi:hypothetical protein